MVIVIWKLTSRQTKHSNGDVKNILIANKSLDILIRCESWGKLFKIFPFVLSVKTKYPPSAIAIETINDHLNSKI